MDQSKKFLYINADASDADNSISYPIRSLVAVDSASETSVVLHFRDGNRSDTTNVTMGVTSGKTKQVMQAIAEAINFDKSHTITIGDDHLKSYLTVDITSVGTVQKGDDVFTFQGGVMGTVFELTPAADVSIARANHAGRLLLIPSVATGGGKDNYKLPAPTTVGESYNFSWSGIAADADNIQFQATAADAITFTGGLLDFDTDNSGVGGYVIVFPGANDDLLLLTNPQCFNITFTATSTTNYHVTGYAMSTDTASAFGDL